jgi:hypothetical protein
MIVTVHNGTEQTRYSGIVSINVGAHLNVLVLFSDAPQPIVIAPDQWTRVEVDRIEVQKSEQEYQPGRRAIALKGIPKS